MKKKKFIIGLSIIAVIALYFAYHRFETSIPVEIDAPYGITCTTNRSRMVLNRKLYPSDDCKLYYPI